MPKKSLDSMEAVVKNIEKSMGLEKAPTPLISRYGNVLDVKVDVVPFGIKDLDDASYCGGVPRGKIIEIFGPESSGKSLISLFLIAQAQKMGLECLLADVEQSFDPVWATKHGVDVKKLWVGNAFSCGEQALEYIYRVIESGTFGLVVIDSTAALTPKSELEGTLEDNARVGAQALLLSRGCRKICTACGLTDTTCVFINQVRDKIGVMYGNPETTPGGKALKFYSHQRIRIAKKGTKGTITVKENGREVVVGQNSVVKFVKNKTGRPYGQCEFTIIFDSNALNPVVMLANELKSNKLVTVYGGLLRIAKDVLDNAKPIETGSATMLELANWMVNNNKVVELINALAEELKEDPTAEPLDEKILEMLEDKTKIVAPELANKDNPIQIKKIEDGEPTSDDDAHVNEQEDVEDK